MFRAEFGESHASGGVADVVAVGFDSLKSRPYDPPP